MQHVRRSRKPNYRLAMEVAEHICDVGIKFNPTKLQEIYEHYIQLEEDLQTKLNELVGYEINVHSPSEVTDLLYALFGDATDAIISRCLLYKGKFTTKACKLQKVYLEFGHEELRLITQIRSTHSILTKIVSPSSDKGLLDCLDENNRVHPEPTFGETCRLAYKSPPLTSMPENIKLCQEAEEGYSLYELDYSQQELYIMACWWGIRGFINELKVTSDGYTALAKSVLSINVLNADFRDKVKKAWLAKSYGAQLTTIAEEVGRVFAARFTAAIESIPEYKKVKIQIEREVAQRNYKAVSYFGTVRDLGIGYEFINYAELKRKKLNNPIQMTGADILTFVLEDVMEFILANNLKDKVSIVYTIYDAVLLSVKHGYEHYLDEIKELITYQIDNWLPISLKVTKIA